jgi:hypothetical protein
MAKYLDPEVLRELDEYRKRIFAEREEIYRKYRIDVLDNDTLSSLSVYEIVSQYDADYNINFARNGEDAQSNGVLIEQKCSRVEKRKKAGTYPDALYQFHAMGDLIYPRYILVSRDKTTLELVRMYDISEPNNVKLVQDYLMKERQAWEDRCAIDKKYMKRDVIGIPESELKEKLIVTEQLVINDCAVVRA